MILTVILFVMAFVFFIINVFLLFQFGKKERIKALICYVISMLFLIGGLVMVVKNQIPFNGAGENRTETVIREGRHER